jgi:Tfp pilus assembly protein PilN
MDELTKRAAFAYFGLTIGFVFIAAAMEANGSASSQNPAWVLVSTLRLVFLFPLVLLLLGAAVLAAVFVIERWKENERQLREQILEKERQETARIEWERRRADEEVDRKKRLEQEQRDAELREVKRQEEIERRLKERKKRTTEDAVDAALEDFG